MNMMERILRLMAERKASDIYLSAHSPVLIRINGNCVPINAQVLPARRHRSRCCPKWCPPTRIAGAGTHRRTQHGRSPSKAPATSASAPCASAAATRWWCGTLPPTIPSFADLNLPDILKTLIMEKRGLILMVGATGAGKSTTLASMLDYRNEHASGHILTVEEPIEFTYTNKKSMVNQRDVGSDTHVAADRR